QPQYFGYYLDIPALVRNLILHLLSTFYLLNHFLFLDILHVKMLKSLGLFAGMFLLILSLYYMLNIDPYDNTNSSLLVYFYIYVKDIIDLAIFLFFLQQYHLYTDRNICHHLVSLFF